MSIPTFTIHLEQTDAGPSWWATSDDLPGLSAAADTLNGLLGRLRHVLLDLAVSDGSFVEVLDGDASAPHGTISKQVGPS